MKRREFLKRTGALAGIGAVSSFPSLAHATGKPVVEGVSHPINLPPGFRFSPRYPHVKQFVSKPFCNCNLTRTSLTRPPVSVRKISIRPTD